MFCNILKTLLLKPITNGKLNVSLVDVNVKIHTVW